MLRVRRCVSPKSSCNVLFSRNGASGADPTGCRGEREDAPSRAREHVYVRTVCVCVRAARSLQSRGVHQHARCAGDEDEKEPGGKAVGGDRGKALPIVKVPRGSRTRSSSRRAAIRRVALSDRSRGLTRHRAPPSSCAPRRSASPRTMGEKLRTVAGGQNIFIPAKREREWRARARVNAGCTLSRRYHFFLSASVINRAFIMNTVASRRRASLAFTICFCPRQGGGGGVVAPRR